MPVRRPTFAASVRHLPLARLGACLRELESAGANELHVDVIDGTFARGFSLGFEIVEALREASPLKVCVHLQAERPERYIDDFARLGCAMLIVPIEACLHAHRIVTRIREAGMKSGVSIGAGSPLTKLEYVLPLVDRVLVPVRDGESDDDPPHAAFERVRILRENVDYQQTGASIAVEGNLRAVDAKRLIESGANHVVIDRRDVLRVEPLETSLRAYLKK